MSSLSRMYDLGILGGGQLARMSILAAHPLGVTCLSLDPDANSPTAQVGPAEQGSITDAHAIARVMRQCRSVTFENEFIPADVLREACKIADFDPANVLPGIDCLATIQDKLTQRQAYLAAGVPSPRAVPLDEIDQLGFPCVIKSRFGGYDGKGVRIVDSAEEFEFQLKTIDPDKWFAEEFVPFESELAVMVTVDREGKTGIFPTMVTEQRNHVCDLVYPTEVDAGQVALLAVKAVGGKGLFGVELFALADGRILVNEIAPRPHNSGHYTQNWGGTTQFEQHIRVASGIPIDTNPMGFPTAMANVLGQSGEINLDAARAELMAHLPSCHLHWYGKSASKPGRKMGHINVSLLDLPEDEEDPNAMMLRDLAHRARDVFYTNWTGKPE